MLAQCDTKLGRAHIFLCTLCFCMPTCFCMHVYPVSQLALHPVSLEPDVDGWMDVEEEQHSTSQGLALQLNKHSSD